MKTTVLLAVLSVFFSIPVYCRDAELSQLPPVVERMKYHLRLEPSKNRKAVAEMVWNVRGDSARVMKVEIPPVTETDERTGFDCRWKLLERTGDTENLIASDVFRTWYRNGAEGFSIILNADRTGGTLCMGGDRIGAEIPVDFDCLRPGGVGYTSSADLKELRNTVWYMAGTEAERSRFGSRAEVEEYIRASVDSREGLWEFMDRENDPGKAVPGAAYELAVISDSAGGYEIVNLGDMTVKGRMRPTPFAGNYDLEWRDADGRDAGPECHAAYELQNLAVRFHFPLLGASLRFRKK